MENQLEEYAEKRNREWEIDNKRLNELLGDVIWAKNQNSEKINRILQKRIDMEISGIIDFSDLKVGTKIILDKNRGEAEITKVYQDKNEHYYSVSYKGREIQTIKDRIIRIVYKKINYFH